MTLLTIKIKKIMENDLSTRTSVACILVAFIACQVYIDVRTSHFRSREKARYERLKAMVE